MKTRLAILVAALAFLLAGMVPLQAADASTSCSTLQQRLVASYLSSGDVSGAAKYTHLCPAACPQLAAVALAVASTDMAALAQDAYATCIANVSQASGNNGGACQTKNFAVASVPTITGTAKKGLIIVAQPGSWSPKPLFAFRWLRDGNPISGAVQNYYQIGSADVGHKLSVKVTSVQIPCYFQTSRTSSSTKIVVK
jgi:hypothetical protein